MKKPYCRPQLTVIALEAQDIVCRSVISVTIAAEPDPQRSGETPPLFMGGGSQP